MVTIVGSGIAGTALAGALAEAGHSVTVYDQHNGGTGGAFLFLDGRGHRSLIELGVSEEELHAASYPLEELRFTPKDGTPRRQPSAGHRFWLRADLIRVLQRFALDAGVDIRYGSPVTELVVDEHSGVTTFRTGDQMVTTDDLVIGADGIDSAARAGIEPQRSTEYAGDVVVYGMTRTPVECPSDPFVLHFHAEAASAQRCGSTLGYIWRPGAAAALWFLRITREQLADADTGVVAVGEWADSVVAATPTVMRELTATLVDATEHVYVGNARNVPLHNAAAATLPVLLVGDADHAITPAVGFGAREGIEDVEAVYRAIMSGASPAAAMTARRHAMLDERDRAARTVRRVREPATSDNSGQ